MLGLLRLLEGIKPDPSLFDGWESVISSKGRFTPKSLDLELVNDRPLSFLHKGLWNLGIPSEVSFFLWNAYLNRVEAVTWQKNGFFAWRRRNQWIICYYDKVTRIWGFFFSHLKIPWSFPCHFHELIFRSFGRHSQGPFVGVCGGKWTWDLWRKD